MDVVRLASEHIPAFSVPPSFAGKAECLLKDGEPLALVAFAEIGANAEIVIELTDAGRKASFTILREARRYLDDLRLLRHNPDFQCLRYLTATILRDDAVSIRWIEWLNFDYEGEHLDGTLRYVRKSW